MYPHEMYATFVHNHDLPRMMHELGGSFPKAKLAAAIQFAVAGVPFIYYGEEIGMSATKPDPSLRAPMHWNDGKHAGFSDATPWQPLGSDVNVANVASQTGKPDSLLSWYRTLIRLRHMQPELVESPLVVLKSSNAKILAFTRGSILAVFNLSGEAVVDVGLDMAITDAMKKGIDLLGHADRQGPIELFGVRFVHLSVP